VIMSIKMEPVSYISVTRKMPSNLVFYARLYALTPEMYSVDCTTQWKHIHLVSYGRERVLAELVRELNEVLDSKGLPYSYNVKVIPGFYTKQV